MVCVLMSIVCAQVLLNYIVVLSVLIRLDVYYK